ncbi:MAG TPA: hypothetical protein VI112_14110 [Bacteroidia bacterium]|jgi:hypothetical protein
MKKATGLALLVICIYGCGNYTYYPMPVNAPAFANKFETQASTNLGVHGFYAGSGFSITNRMLLAGGYNSVPGIGGLYSKEGETSAGFNILKRGDKNLNLYAGYGFGNSFHQDSGSTVKTSHGNFRKPFTTISFNTAVNGSKRIKADAILAFKFDYLFYNGYHLTTQNNVTIDEPLNAEHFFYEMYAGGNVGGKHVRFNFGMGFAFKRIADIDKGIRIFPLHMSFGLTYIFFRHYESKENNQGNGDR